MSCGHDTHGQAGVAGLCWRTCTADKGSTNMTGTPHRRQAIHALLDHIRAEALQCGPLTGRPELSDRVMRAMAAVPRDAFVDPDLQDEAWLDAPLPIGHQQTISQPFIVAL